MAHTIGNTGKNRHDEFLIYTLNNKLLKESLGTGKPGGSVLCRGTEG